MINWCFFRVFKSNLIFILISSALSSSESSTSLHHLSTSSSCSSTFSSCLSTSRSNSSLVEITSDSSVIERMRIISHDLSLDSDQNQMFLEIENYVEKKLRFLVLNVEINRNDISEMKKDVENIIISYREMQKLIVEQETCIDDFLCQVIKQKRVIKELQRQVEKYDTFWLALIAWTQSALILLVMCLKDQNVSVAIETCSSVMLSSFLFSLLFHVFLFSLLSDSFLSMTSSFLSSSITQFIIKEMKNILLLFDSFLSMTSSLLSSLTSITQSIIKEMKNTMSFDMSFLFHSFCQYNSLCMFCAVWLIDARVYYHQLLNFRESESWVIHLSYETRKLFVYWFMHLLTAF